MYYVSITDLTKITSRSDLEKAVEELSQMLEEEVEDDSVKALRLRTVDKTVRHTPEPRVSTSSVGVLTDITAHVCSGVCSRAA